MTTPDPDIPPASTADDPSARRWWGRPRFVVAATVVIGLLATALGTWAVASATNRAVDSRFTAIATDVGTQVERRLSATESAVLAARGLFDTEAAVSSLDFFRFTDALARGRALPDRFPGMTALAALDADGRVIVTAPSHPPIRNAVSSLVGTDQLGQILERAAGRALPTTNGLVSDTTVVDLVIVTARYDDAFVDPRSATLPERREAVIGWTLALLRADGMLGDVLPTGVSGIGATLHDDAGRRLGSTGRMPADPAHERVLPLSHSDETLELAVVANRDIATPAERRLPSLVALTGILLTAAGAAVLWLVTTQRERALEQVAQATTELEHTNGELADSNQRLREFAGVVAHDLRGPLTGIHGMVTILERRIGDQLEPMDAEVLARAQRAATHMGDLIADVLRYAEAGVTPTDVQVMDLTAVVEELLERLEHALQPGDAIEVHTTHQVVADPTGLRRVLGNLVGNALKYRHDGQPARIEVRSHRRGDRVVVEVHDDGPGIAVDQREEMTTPFRRGTTSQKGSGLGLAICVRIIAHHGGTFELDDAELGGALVRFDLPAAP